MTEINWSRYIPEEAIVFELEKPKKLRFGGFKEATVAAHKEGVIDPIMMPTLVLTVTHEDEKPVFKKWYCAANDFETIHRRRHIQKACVHYYETR